MFAVHCPRHGARVLLSERRIRALHIGDTGMVMEAECYDGERIFVVTGRGVLDGHDARARLRAARRLLAAAGARGAQASMRAVTR
jgi:hypothetical protein